MSSSVFTDVILMPGMPLKVMSTGSIGRTWNGHDHNSECPWFS